MSDKNTNQHSISDKLLSPALFEILKILEVRHEGTLSSIVEATQKAWLLPQNTEQSHIENSHRELASALKPYFKKLGIIDEIRPTEKNYEYAIIFGTLVSRFRQRIAYVLQLWLEGIRFKKLVVLTGERPLEPTMESEDILYNRSNTILPIRASWMQPIITPTTESEMAQMLFKQADLPQDLTEKVPTIFVDTPQLRDPHGVRRRPNTGDTVCQWLSHQNPLPGSVLAVSNQPYIGYQDAVMKTILPITFMVDTVGAQASENEPLDELLDTLARWLYQVQKYQQSKK